MTFPQLSLCSLIAFIFIFIQSGFFILRLGLLVDFVKENQKNFYRANSAIQLLLIISFERLSRKKKEGKFHTRTFGKPVPD